MELTGMHLILAIVWFLLWGVLWAVYFALDGFDLGVGTLLPFLAKDEMDKRIMYEAVGPFWDGNEVWLISAGGVTFAAFPFAYSVMFSWLYSPLLLLLFGLILRGVSMEYRSKIENPGWRKMWDTLAFIGSFVPALLLGVAFANIFQGLPFTEGYVNNGSILDLLNPYGLAGGVLFVILFVLHGALWLAVRAVGDLQERAKKLAVNLWIVMLIAVLLFLTWTYLGTHIFDIYLKMPVLFLVLLLPVAMALVMRGFMASGRWWLAWGSSAVMLVGTTLFAVIGLFPALIPSSTEVAGLTIHNSAASELTLSIMLGVALVFVPVVIIYQAWAYKKFAHPVDPEALHY
ncbi:MAG: cytochrome d ubiquinol oxidase subunit II [Desulfovibrionaceae bacterium]